MTLNQVETKSARKHNALEPTYKEQ